MRNAFAFLAAAALALGACGQSGSDGTANGGSTDPARTAAEMSFGFQPGQYRTTISIDKIDVPGLPAAMLDQMKGAIGRPIKVEYCMSPEQAGKGAEAMKEHMAKGKCQFEKFEASAGKVESTMVCESQGGTIRTTSKGNYTPTRSVIRGSGDLAAPGGRKMHIEQTVTMERIGDCTT